MPHETLRIPQPAEEGCTIAATLELVEPAASATSPRPIALILHGVMGHKDYLFQKRLAKSFPMDSCRFDFRGNHETPGANWSMGGLADDLEDVKAVVALLTAERGYVVHLVVGHSRGSVVGMKWASTTTEGRGILGFVNVSGRYRMNVVAAWKARNAAEIEKQGYYVWNARVAGQQISRRVYPHMLDAFGAWDTSYLSAEFPPRVDVLTIHGLADKLVPPYDAVLYAIALSNRPDASHTLHMIEEADHNFIGHQDEVVNTILAWWDRKQRGLLENGIWLPSQKTKM